MKTIRIVGVPEHFNLPWLMAIDEGVFKTKGINLEWMDVPEGTGKMSQLLQENNTDLAIILTEGIIRSIIEGNPSKIIQSYISSPLLWGIHVGENSPYHQLDELEGTIAAISRKGSGSHLMSYVNAKKNNWKIDKLKFNIINTLDGAIESLTSGTSDYFLWEKFTTKPYVDTGVFRRLGSCPTPWPCFVIAASSNALKNHHDEIKVIVELINSYTREFKKIPSIDRTLANTYNQEINDIQEWLQITEWSQSQLERDTLEEVQNTLFTLNLIQSKVDSKSLITNL